MYAELMYEIVEDCNNPKLGKGCWLMLNDGLCRGWSYEAMKKHGLTKEQVVEEFKNEIEFFGGKLKA